MTQPIKHDSNKPVLESDKPRRVYEPPTLKPLENCNIATGDSNVPENNNGLLDS